MEIRFPGLYFPDLIIKEGWLCDTWIVGVHVVIPPTEIFIHEGFWIWREFVIFDTAWLPEPLRPFFEGVMTYVGEKTKEISDKIDKVRAGEITITEAFASIFAGLIDDAKEALKGTILGTVWKWVEGSLAWASDCLNIINDNVKATRMAINEGLAGITTDLFGKIDDLIMAIPEAVWDLLEGRLNSMVEDYYERHSED